MSISIPLNRANKTDIPAVTSGLGMRHDSVRPTINTTDTANVKLVRVGFGLMEDDGVSVGRMMDASRLLAINSLRNTVVVVHAAFHALADASPIALDSTRKGEGNA